MNLTSIYADRFTTVPKPMTDVDSAFGVHPVVCCPEPLPESAICFPSDPWCQTYEAPAYEEYQGCQESSETFGEGQEGDYQGEVTYDYDAFASPSAATVLLYNCDLS